jgi:acyl dehydratase
MPPVVVETILSLKEFVGREITVTDWLKMTQERISQFAEASEDRQWIHVDPERAQRESPYGSTIAHGFLTLSLLSYFMKQAIHFREGARMAVNYGLNRVRFPSPVRAGDNIRARFGLVGLEESADALQSVFSVEMEVENSDKPWCASRRRAARNWLSNSAGLRAVERGPKENFDSLGHGHKALVSGQALMIAIVDLLDDDSKLEPR